MNYHKQVSVLNGAIECDEEIADIIATLNHNSFETYLSCQEDGVGKVWIHFVNHDLDELIRVILSRNEKFFYWLEANASYGIRYDENGEYTEVDEHDESQDTFIGDRSLLVSSWMRFDPKDLKEFKEYFFSVFKKVDF